MKNLFVFKGDKSYDFRFGSDGKCSAVPAEWGMTEFLGEKSNAIIKEFKKRGFKWKWDDSVHLQFDRGVSHCGEKGKMSSDPKVANCKLCFYELSLI